MVGCFRRSDANDPEVYAAAVVAALVRWPVDVITSVTEPATGLPSKLNWLPSIAEITQACADAYKPPKAEPVYLPPPPRPSQQQLDAQFERLGLAHLRPGSQCRAQQPRFSPAEQAEAMATLAKYQTEANNAQRPLQPDLEPFE